MRPPSFLSSARSLVWFGILLGVCAPGAAAQRGGRGARDHRGMPAGGIIGDPSPTLTAEAVARINPLAMILDQRAALGLADSQVTRLTAMRDRLQSRNAPHLRALDSLLREIRRHDADTLASEGDRLMRKGDDRLAFTAVLGRIRDNDDAAALDAMDLFTGRQLRWAYDVVRQQRTIMAGVIRGGNVPQRTAAPDTIRRPR
jgi:hypothetical protein